MLILAYIISLLSLFTGGSFEKQVENYLSEKLKGYDNISFEIVSLPRTDKGEQLKIDDERELKVAGNMAYLPVIISGRNGRASLSVATLKVKLYRSVLTARSSVLRGSEINPSDFELKTVEVSKLRGNPLQDFSALSGFRAKMNIKEGEVLIQENLEALPVIKRGDKISAVAGSGNVVISIDASAREDGRIGQVIRVETADKKLFRAKVIDQFTVRITE